MKINITCLRLLFSFLTFWKPKHWGTMACRKKGVNFSKNNFPVWKVSPDVHKSHSPKNFDNWFIKRQTEASSASDCAGFRSVALTDAGHLVPGDAHSQMGHFRSNSWQANQPLHAFWNVPSKLFLQYGWCQLQVLHLSLEKVEWMSEKPINKVQKQRRRGRSWFCSSWVM